MSNRLAKELARSLNNPSAVICVDDPRFLQGQLAINRAQSRLDDTIHWTPDQLAVLSGCARPGAVRGLTGRARELTKQHPPRKLEEQVRRIG